MFLRRIQRLQICKLSTDVRGILNAIMCEIKWFSLQVSMKWIFKFQINCLLFERTLKIINAKPLQFSTSHFAFGIFSLDMQIINLYDVYSVYTELENYIFDARNVRLYYLYWQYTDLFIFRFLSLLCLRSTLRLFNFCTYSDYELE